MKAIHYLMLVCAALAAGLPQAAEAFPASAAPWFRGVAAICVLLTAVLGAVSPAVQDAPGAGSGAGGAAVLLFLVAFGLSGCAWLKSHESQVNTAILDVDQIACVMAGGDMSPEAQALACKIPQALLPELLPYIEQLIGQREAARKMGVVFHKPGTDAGAEGGAR